jgi:hypothetical protein
MALVSFTAINRQFRSGEYSFYSSSSEQCFEALSGLVSQGWQLLTVHYGEMNDEYLTCWVELPVEAFDGEPLQEPLMTLQREWEQVLG